MLRQSLALRVALAAALAAVLAVRCRLPLAYRIESSHRKLKPAPLAIRERTTWLKDKFTGLPRQPPKEADDALDFFQRTFPEVTTYEHVLIHRWDDLVDLFGGTDAVTDLIFEDPTVLRRPHPGPRRAFHYLSMYLGGPKVARRVVFKCPLLLTKKAGQMRRTLPALLNIFGTKERLAEIAVRYPMLMHVPTGDFYNGFPEMTAICGSPEAAAKVAKEAMEELAKSPQKSVVPNGYPALVAILGGLEQAKAALNREPLLMVWWGDQYLGVLRQLRLLVGKEGAQKVLNKAPYLLIKERQRKTKKIALAFAAMEKIFGTEETCRRVLERPELLALGVCLERALNFAERKLGSREAVRKDFERVLERTGLADHLHWERKPRPRHGYWSPKTGLIRGYRPNSSSWSPLRNPTGKGGVARGRWDEDEDLEAPGEDFVDAELVDA